MPSAVQPGGKYELEKVSIRTGRPVASSNALARASRVNGQCLASTTPPVAITLRSMTPLIHSHFGIRWCAAGEDCSMSTSAYRQFECRGPGARRFPSRFPCAWGEAVPRDCPGYAPSLWLSECTALHRAGARSKLSISLGVTHTMKTQKHRKSPCHSDFISLGICL